MKKNIVNKLLLLISAFFMFYNFGCKKQINSQNQNDSAIDTISDADVQLLSNLQIDTTTTLADLVFSDGSSVEDFLVQYDSSFYYQHRSTSITSFTPAQQEKILLGRMFQIAINLTLRPDHIFTDVLPNQIGIDYSWGSKSFALRRVPPGNYGPHPGTCFDTIHGLDCSGFIYYVGTTVGLNFVDPDGSTTIPENFANANYFKDTNNWKTAFLPEFPNLKIANMGQLDRTDFQFGDIIVWPGEHIGLIVSPNLFLNSSGGPKACNYNKSYNGGPARRELTDSFLSAFHGGVYTILRVTTPISNDPDGNWLVSWQIQYCDSASGSHLISVSGGQFNATIGSYTTIHGTSETISIQGTITVDNGGSNLFDVSGNEFLSGNSCNGGNGFQGYITVSGTSASGSAGDFWGPLTFTKQ